MSMHDVDPYIIYLWPIVKMTTSSLPLQLKPFLHLAEILGDPFVKMVPLPRFANYRDLGRRQNPLYVRNSNIAERTQARKNLNRLN